MTTVLLTRPHADAKRLADQLEPRGFTCLLAPVLRIEACALDTMPDITPQAVIVSSRHAVQQHDWSHLRDVPVIAVGQATASAAERAGFRQIARVPGSAREIARYLQAARSPQDGPLLYLRGQNITLDLAAQLPSFHVVEYITYRATPTDQLSDAALHALYEKRVQAATFFSPRSAELFMHYLPAEVSLRSVVACCLSRRVAEQFSAARWQRIHICARPDTPAMIALLEETFHVTN